MPRQSLDRILDSLATKDPSLASAPIEQTAQAITDAAADGARGVIDTERENAISSTVRSWYSAAKSARQPLEQQWLKNLDMYAGRQFTEYDRNSKSMKATANPSGEPRKVINIILPTVRTEMAKTGSTHPTATVSPSSDDQEDLMAALAAERAWDWFYDSAKFHSATFSPANFWRTVCGNGFGKVYWDYASADPAQQAAATQLWQEQQAQQAQGGLDIPMPAPEPKLGQIRTKPVTPFHLFVPDLTELSLQDQPYVIHAYTLQTATAKMIYGALRGPDWVPAEARADTLLDPNRIGVPGQGSSAKSTVMVVEAWVKPGMTSQLPAGGYVVLVGDDLVGFVDHYPYDHGLYPFLHLPGIESGGFYRTSVVEHITPIQDEVNRTANQQIKNRNMVTAPQMFYDEGSVDPNRIRPRAGQYIPIRLGMKDPRPVVYAPLPQWVDNFHDRLGSYREDISGQHQVSKAQSPGADTAASALSLLREADDDYLSTVYDGIQDAMTDAARMVIGLMVQFWDEPRLIKAVGKEEAADAKILAGADLRGGTDIKIDGDSMLPQSKTAKIATVTDWMDKGYVPPQVGLDVLEMGQLGPAYKRMKIDVNQARRETVKLGRMDLQELLAAQQQGQQQVVQDQAQGIVDQAAQGPQMDPTTGAPIDPMAPTDPEPMALPVNWYDNHEVHIVEHKAFAKTQEFEMWEPERQEELRLHVAAHEREVMLAMPPLPPDGEAVVDGQLAAQQPAMPAQPAGSMGAPSPQG